jgi:HEPN superfamily AbiU2-like protein
MYKEYHELFSNEIYQATACYVFWNRLQNEPAKSEKLLAAFNVSPLSWIVIRHSMMVSLIMALSRIFDTDGDAVSINDLIKSCIEDIEIFSKDSLKKRKATQHGSEKWIEGYIEKAYEPSAKDFQMLKPEIYKYKKIYQEYYRPIRHKIFAHSDKMYFSNTDELWNATKNTNMVEMLNFLEDVKVTLQMAYDNGEKPDLKGREIDEQWFSKDILSLFERVKNA